MLDTFEPFVRPKTKTTAADEASAVVTS
jgi:hypothetical protein